MQNARWCDDILQEQVIEPAIIKVWLAFEKHMTRLAKGSQPERRLTLASGGAIERLRSGKHMEARSLLLQIHNMNALCLPFLATSSEPPTSILELASQEAGVVGAASASRIKALHDEVEEAANAWIAEKCDKAKTKVLDRPGPLGEMKRWDWWMDLCVLNSNFTDALTHLNVVLDLSKWLLATPKGNNQLDGWLQLDELKLVQGDCHNRARELISRVKERATGFFHAVGSCHVREMDAAIALLKGDSAPAAAADGRASDVASDVSAEEASIDGVPATRAACSELKDILSLFSRPKTYAAIFEAVRDHAEESDAVADDLTAFSELCGLYQTAFMDAQNNFMDPMTEPRARQKALFIFKTFDRKLPPDKVFEQFKQHYITWNASLVQSDRMAQSKMNAVLKEKRERGEFDSQMRDILAKMRSLGKYDGGQRRAYEQEVSRIATRLLELLEDFNKHSRFLKYPDTVRSSPFAKLRPGHPPNACACSLIGRRISASRTIS